MWARCAASLPWLLAALLSACRAQEERSGLPPLVLWGVTVVDGTGAAPRAHQALVLSEGTIAALGPADQVEVPAGAQVLDLTGRFVLPGFVDLHVHFPADRHVQAAMLDRLLEYGITTVLIPGARPGAGVALRERVRRGEVRGPRIVSAGRIIDGEPPHPGIAPWCARVASEAAIRAEVRAQAAEGVDWIKLYERLPPRLVEVGIEEAHALGLEVALHAGSTTWGEAARAGVDMLVHSGYGTPMDELLDPRDWEGVSDAEWYRAYAEAPRGAAFQRLVDLLVSNGVTVVPTLSITQASGLGRDARLLPQFRTDLAPDADIEDWWSEGWRTRHPQHGEVEAWEEELLEEVYFPGVLGILRAYHERGVRLGVGTDVGNSWMTPGYVYHHELELYQEAGIAPGEIWRMATHNGAAALGILDEVGTLEVGKRADLVVLSEDPVRDVRASLAIEAVFLDGRRVDSFSGRGDGAGSSGMSERGR